jgi:hypothetical protein
MTRKHALTFRFMSAWFVLVTMAGCGVVPQGGDDVAQPGSDALQSLPQYPDKAICGDAQPGHARCHARVRVDDRGDVVSNATPSGFGPTDLRSAYNIPSGGGAGVTVAIVDAYDNPNAESDLAVYRAQYGLPACTTANGCFKKVNQSGQASPLPLGNTNWGVEISLDLDMISAGCPSCKILLVEAASNAYADLGAAVNTAAALGATIISNSYGGVESSLDTSYDSQYYNHSGVTILASTGDSGYGPQYPATGAHVIAVGGTSLARSTNSRGWTETAWSGAGSGCSAFIAKPSFQTDTGCSRRTVADVSAVANPSTGVAVYDTYGGSGAGAAGWEVYGGTSVASPLVAAILAATGKAGIGNCWPYANRTDFYDVTTGSNGTCGGAPYLCTAEVGYDGPTGLGTPDGVAIKASTSTCPSSVCTPGDDRACCPYAQGCSCDGDQTCNANGTWGPCEGAGAAGHPCP